MVFGKHIEYDGEDYYCKLCSRWFYSWTALMGHCRNTTRHEWCETCKRVFRTAQELDQHKNASGNHHICDWCNYRPDFETALELENHRVKCHDMCRLCGETFQNENNLRMHLRRHQPKDKECFGCYMMFGSNSAMLIHLEAGTCPSRTDLDEINDLAFRCYQHRQYTNGIDGYYPFYCPGCLTDFRTVSGLFQHAETRESCSHTLDYPLGKLLHFISRQV